MLYALLLALAYPQDAAPITFQRPAARLEVLLPELGEQAGVELEAAGSLRGEVMYVNVRSRTVPEVMELIAYAADAEWEPTRTGQRLIRTVARERELERREIERRTELV